MQDMDEGKEKEGNVPLNEDAHKSSASVDNLSVVPKWGEKRGKTVVETEADLPDQSRPERLLPLSISFTHTTEKSS